MAWGGEGWVSGRVGESNPKYRECLIRTEYEEGHEDHAGIVEPLLAPPFDEHGAVEGEPEHGASVQPAVNVSDGDLGQRFGHEVDEVDEERADVADDRSLEGGRRL